MVSHRRLVVALQFFFLHSSEINFVLFLVNIASLPIRALYMRGLSFRVLFSSSAPVITPLAWSVRFVRGDCLRKTFLRILIGSSNLVIIMGFIFWPTEVTGSAMYADLHIELAILFHSVSGSSLCGIFASFEFNVAE
jgi:hypothetical protein